jgi:quercetin dioxygenase-like cupin family protein
MHARSRSLAGLRVAVGSVGALTLLGCAPAAGENARARDTPAPAASSPAMSMVTLDSEAMTWRPLQPPGFPPGIQLAVIHGDRTRAEPFTVRLRFPAGFRFPAHRHPSAEHLTVIRGELAFAAGERFDEQALRRHQPGDYVIAPAGMAHFGGADEETVVQLHGIGPFSITVVDPYLPSRTH